MELKFEHWKELCFIYDVSINKMVNLNISLLKEIKGFLI